MASTRRRRGKYRDIVDIGKLGNLEEYLFESTKRVIFSGNLVCDFSASQKFKESIGEKVEI